MSRRIYAIHRWIAAIALAQLLVWTTTGFLFSVLPEASVDGAQVPRAHEAPIPDGSGAVAPDIALQRASAEGVRNATKVELRSGPVGLFYVVRGEGGPLRLDARTGAPAPVTLAEAEETARRDQPNRPAVASSSLIEKDAHSEFRTKSLPAFRVALADESGTVVYVDARTGDVTARRTNTWRLFDFFFLLHTMDYKAAGSINSPLLVGASLLGLTTVLSGLVLWCISIIRRLRGRSEPPARPDVNQAPGAV